MKRRLLAAIAALVLLVVGTAVLLAYVEGADARALAGVRTTEVLVADQVVPEGTTADELAPLVRTEVLPEKAALDGRVTDLGELAGQVATVELRPGEQLLAARFAAPDSLDSPDTVPVPVGLQEVSILLEPQRAIGGRLAAGDAVGVIVSIGDGKQTGETGSVMHGVLVTEVVGARTPAGEAADAETEAAAGAVPAASLMITLAVTAGQAEAVAYGMEHGSIWLSLENEDADTRGTDRLDAGTIYVKDFP